MSGFYPDLGPAGGGTPGAGVESVTGPTVDNTDPLNPIVGAVNETAAGIKTKYESNADTNAYTDAEKAVVAQQSGTNTGDETAASIKTKYESNADTNAYTDAEKAKLAGLEDSLFLGEYPTLAALQLAHPTAPAGAYAYVDAGPGQDVEKYIFDSSDQEWIKQQGESTAETPASIKTKYESNADTNAYTDAEKAVVAQQSGTNTGDETAASIKTKYESNADTNAYTDAEKAALPNKITKPAAPGATADILRRTTAGAYVNYTPVGGAVKLNDVLVGVALPANNTVPVDLDGGTESFSSIGDFPRNLANQFPGQDPQNNPATFLPLLYDSATGRWLENPIDRQVHRWRVTMDYTRGTVTNNRELVFTLSNPATSFVLRNILIMPGGAEFQDNEVNVEFSTVADSSSIGSGYELEIFANGNGSQITINSLDILVDYQEKI